MKHIPNIFTLLNLFFGCLAILSCIQPQFIITADQITGELFFTLPETIYKASFFIFIAAIIDFADGFVARLLNAQSELGKQLDSLADVVSFGVAPSMIIYQFLKLSFAGKEGGVEIAEIYVLPAFTVACAGAYRLGKFNLITTQLNYFKGLPIPAAGLFIASFPLIYWNNSSSFISSLLLNEWFWYAIILSVSYLMLSSLPMLALKFKSLQIRVMLPFIILAVIIIVSSILFQWLAVPVAFLSYIILSLIFKPFNHDVPGSG